MFKLILLWLLLGLLSVLFVIIRDMRGQEYNPNYFKFDGFVTGLIIAVFLGPLSLIVVIILNIYYKYQKYINNNPEKSFTRLIYNLANIGLEKDAANSDQEEQ